MDAQTHPGQGLSLPQLVVALKQELRRTAYSDPPSYGIDEASQLDQDFTTILAAIREWRNSLVSINRLPEDILSLIPTYLSHQSDRLRASFVCLHWRRTFLQRAELWSKMYLWKGEDYMESLLERSKEFVLDVSISGRVPASTITLLSPHIKRIGRLNFAQNNWVDIQKFSETTSGSLSLLHTLDINVTEESDLERFDVITPSLLTLFSNVTHLKEFYFYSDTKQSPSINHFIFPNLVSLVFSASPSEGFHASPLLDFLEASPTLQTIHVRIVADLSLGEVPRDRVVVLPNVETFDLGVTGGGLVYKLAAHISCPSVRYTGLAQEDDDPEQAFCTSDSWDAIVRQYTRSPAEEVTLETRTTPIFTSKLAFRSPDTTVLELNFRIDLDEGDEDKYELGLRTAGAVADTFTQAARVIENHPQVDSVKRLNVCHSFHFAVYTYIPYLANEARRLFMPLGPLDELTIYHCDIRPYFHSFLDVPEGDITERIPFPSIKQLTISQPLNWQDERCTAGFIELAKSQHALGIPFERVIICWEDMPMGMEEGLRPWVGNVEHRDDSLHGQWSGI